MLRCLFAGLVATVAFAVAVCVGFYFGWGAAGTVADIGPAANATPQSARRGEDGKLSISSGLTGPSISDARMADLNQRAERITEMMRQVRQQHKSEWEAALATNPKLGELVDYFEKCQDELLAEKESPTNRSFVAWASGPPIEIADPIYAKRTEQVGELRKALFVDEVASLLADPANAPAVKRWLGHRLKTMGLDKASDDFLATADNWRVVGDSLFPEKRLLQAVVGGGGEAMLRQYLASRRLDVSPAGVPPEHVAHVRRCLRLGILNGAAYQSMRDQMPANLRQSLEAYEHLMRELSAVNEQRRMLKSNG